MQAAYVVGERHSSSSSNDGEMDHALVDRSQRVDTEDPVACGSHRCLARLAVKPVSKAKLNRTIQDAS